MSRVFPADKENNQWIVRMSVGKKLMKSTDVNNQQRKLSIHKTSPKKKQMTEKWKEDLLDFIVESKKQVDTEARNAIEMVEKWQQDTCARLDIVQQHICDTSHEITRPLPESLFQAMDLHMMSTSPVPTEISHFKSSSNQTAVNNSSKNNVSTKPFDGKTVNSPDKSSNRPVEPVKSMPILVEETSDDDNLEAFLKKPMGTKPVEKLFGKKIVKRRQSDTHYSPLNETFDFPVRKKSSTFHSSVLAQMFNSPPKIMLDVSNEPPKDAETEKLQSTISSNSSKPLAVANKDKRHETQLNGKQNTWSSNSMDKEKSALFQKFLETKKKVEERAAMKAQHEATNLVVVNGENSSQTQPNQ